MKPDNFEICLVLCTCPDQAVAERLSKEMIDVRLAACVNIVGNVNSIFRWQEKVQRENEVLLMIKTSSSRYASLVKWLEAHHPYDVPEILMLPVGAGLDAYVDWVKDETRKGCGQIPNAV